MTIKKERKTRTVRAKVTTKVQKIADAINSYKVGMVEKSIAIQEGRLGTAEEWAEYAKEAIDRLMDLGIDVEWRKKERKEMEVKNLPIQQDLPFE